MRVAVIPARGGSKRIPNKNLKSFCGKPIISYSIETTLACQLFDKIIVSTDSEEIADKAISMGADVPFIRPADLSDDYSTTGDVMQHSVNWLLREDIKLELVCCIYATAPLLLPGDLMRGYSIFSEGTWDYVFAGSKFSYPVQRGFTKDSSGELKMLNPEYFETRSQDLDNVYHDAGQFYYGQVNAWSENSNIIGSNSTIVELKPWQVHDIDDYEDWEMAEKLFIMKRQSE